VVTGVSSSRPLGALPSERLAELELSLPAVPKPAGAYVPAVRQGEVIFTSGQLPYVDGVLPYHGLVGREEQLGAAASVSVEQAYVCARICAMNALAAVASVVGSLDVVTGIVKVTGYVASAAGFTGQPAVLNGASELLGSIFGVAGRHVRSAVGVAALPGGAPVEVELIVSVASR
jgi:enamine deaminase RidA (YjgF/YER057c/UK114 family)